MFKKKVEFKKGVPGNLIFWIVLVAVLVTMGFLLQNGVAWACLLGVAVLLVKRLYGGKLKLEPSDLVLFWGLPGGGKTLFLTKTAKDNHKQWYIGVNPEYTHLKIKDFDYTRDDMGRYTFPGAALFFDEASLNGFDNREFKTNFKAPGLLETFKKHRQMDMPIVMSNQGFEECDIKIRQSLANKTYFCENFGLFCRASLMIRDVTISEIDGQPQEGYRFPTFTERLIDPSMQIYAVPWFYGRYYSTKSPPARAVHPGLVRAKSLRKV